MTCEKCIHYEVCQYRGGRAYEAEQALKGIGGV